MYTYTTVGKFLNCLTSSDSFICLNLHINLHYSKLKMQCKLKVRSKYSLNIFYNLLIRIVRVKKRERKKKKSLLVNVAISAGYVSNNTYATSMKWTGTLSPCIKSS